MSHWRHREIPCRLRTLDRWMQDFIGRMVYVVGLPVKFASILQEDYFHSH
jgi:hypothetical protein